MNSEMARLFTSNNPRQPDQFWSTKDINIPNHKAKFRSEPSLLQQDLSPGDFHKVSQPVVQNVIHINTLHGPEGVKRAARNGDSLAVVPKMPKPLTDAIFINQVMHI